MARLFFAIGASLGSERLRDAAQVTELSEHFDRLAIRKLVADLQRHQRTLTEAVIEFAGKAPAEDADAAWAHKIVAAWRETHADAVGRVDQILSSMEFQSGVTVGKLTLAGRQFRELAASAI